MGRESGDEAPQTPTGGTPAPRIEPQSASRRNKVRRPEQVRSVLTTSVENGGVTLAPKCEEELWNQALVQSAFPGQQMFSEAEVEETRKREAAEFSSHLSQAIIAGVVSRSVQTLET